MTKYSRDQIEAAFQDYAGRGAALRDEAKAAVVEWTYADDWTYGLHPLFAEAEMGPDRWKPKKLKWGPKESFPEWYAQGVDAEGRVRVVNAYDRYFRIFVHGDGFIDQVRLRGETLVVLERAEMEEGRVRALYGYTREPHQTFVDVCEYENGRCVRTVQQTEYVSDGEWKTATWKTICEFEYDDQGLARAYQDQPGLSARKLIFRRPGRRSTAKKKERRPLVAYVVHRRPDEVEPGHSVYSDLYGLEMTFDDEWPLDIVPLIPTDCVREFYDSTDLASRGTVYAGAISDSDSADFGAMARKKAKWTRIDGERSDAAAQVAAAGAAGLNVLLVASDEARVAAALQPQEPQPKSLLAAAASLAGALGRRKSSGPGRLAVALRPGRPLDPAEAQASAQKVRAALAAVGCAESRIVLAGSAMKAARENYLTQPDLDGVYLDEGGFGSAVEAAGEIAMLRATE